MKIKNKIFFGIILFILFIIFFSMHFHFIKNNNRKEVGIYASVSKDISNDAKMKKDLKYFASNLDVNKFNYTVPNSTDGVIGHFLNNVGEKDKPYILTTYSSTFPINKMNTSFEVKIFDDPFTYEEYMLKKSDIFVFFPGGVGTLYEIAFALLLLDIVKKDYIVLIYNKDNYFQFIKNQMEFFKQNGFLRGHVYEKFKSDFLFFDNMDDLVAKLNSL